MNDFLSRSIPLLGQNGIEKLNKSNVAVFGLGGVGSYAVEALARSGVGNITLIDNDVYSTSNLNRQLYATQQTVGIKKTQAAKERILQINPTVNVTVFDDFILPNTCLDVDFSKFDYVIDAIDTVLGKLEIIKRAKEAGVLVISAMGTGNKLDPTAFKVADIFKTKVCPLCKAMRSILRKNGIDNLKVVYSEEEPIKSTVLEVKGNAPAPSSVSFVPSVVGLICAGEAIKSICCK